MTNWMRITGRNMMKFAKDRSMPDMVVKNLRHMVMKVAAEKWAGVYAVMSYCACGKTVERILMIRDFNKQEDMKTLKETDRMLKLMCPTCAEKAKGYERLGITDRGVLMTLLGWKKDSEKNESKAQ